MSFTYIDFYINCNFLNLNTGNFLKLKFFKEQFIKLLKNNIFMSTWPNYTIQNGGCEITFR